MYVTEQHDLVAAQDTEGRQCLPLGMSGSWHAILAQLGNSTPLQSMIGHTAPAQVAPVVNTRQVMRGRVRHVLQVPTLTQVKPLACSVHLARQEIRLALVAPRVLLEPTQTAQVFSCAANALMGAIRLGLG